MCHVLCQADPPTRPDTPTPFAHGPRPPACSGGRRNVVRPKRTGKGVNVRLLCHARCHVMVVVYITFCLFSNECFMMSELATGGLHLNVVSDIKQTPIWIVICDMRAMNDILEKEVFISGAFGRSFETRPTGRSLCPSETGQKKEKVFSISF